MKRKMTVSMTALLVLALFSTMAFAWSVSFISKSLPSSAKVGSASTFSARIKYDSTVYGVPVPVDGHFHVEVPQLFDQPIATSGSWSNWSFNKTTGSMTGKSVWEGHQTFLVFGEVERSATFRATAKTKGSSQSYIGTGPTVTGVHEFQNVTVN